MNQRNGDPVMLERTYMIWRVMATVSMAMTISGGVTAQDRRSERDATETLIAETERFRLHSDFRMNLHDYLYFLARRDSTRGANTVIRCAVSVSASARETWRRAVQVYVDSLAQLGGFDRPMIHIRYVLSGVPGHGMVMPNWAASALDDAKQVYRSCVWEGQDERNRVWAATVVPLVQRFEAQIGARLEDLYGIAWEPEPIRVDLVTYVSRQGANSVTNPSHILVNTFDEDYKGHGGLEMLFHEASHTLIGPRRGPIAAAIRAAASQLAVSPPRDLWHVVLFYTTGMTVRNVLRAGLGVEYEPYLYSTGLFDRAWPELRQPVERHWTPYLEGRTGHEEAALNVVRALR